MRKSEERRRVVVTGMGAVTSLGQSVEAIWNAVLEGQSGVRFITQFDSRPLPVSIGSEVDIDSLGPAGGDSEGPYSGRAIRFGIHAATQAAQAAGLDGIGGDPARFGVCVGASTFPVIEDRLGAIADIITPAGLDRAAYVSYCRQRPAIVAQCDAASISRRIARHLGFSGSALTIQAACTSATQAIGHAFETIARGDLDLVVAGGTDSMLSMMCVTGFTLLNALSKRWTHPSQASRPFDRTRDGFVAGEGAAMLVLEDLESARSRGAFIHAEVVGYGSSSDAHRFTDVHPEGLGIALSMERALSMAGLQPSNVSYLNAHGTSTPLNDSCETKGIRRAFGACADNLPVSSTKSQLGHLLCAAGAIEMVMTVLAVREGTLPQTINLNHPDPDCDLDFIPGKPRRADAVVAMSNSCGFGGQNGSLIVRRWDGYAAQAPRRNSKLGGRPRVVVTGVGLISPLGTTARKHRARLMRLDSQPFCGEFRIPEFDRRRFIANRMLRKILTRASSFAAVAAGQAIRDAGVRRRDPGLRALGIYAGSLGLDQELEAFTRALRASIRDGVFDMGLFAERGMAMIDPLFLVKSLPNSGLCGISIEFGITGPNLNIMNGRLSVLQAIEAAAEAIRDGVVSTALTGGYDSLFQLESSVARDIAGDPTLPGEGAGFLLLEREDVAIERGARIYGEIACKTGHCAERRLTPVPADFGVAGAAFLAIETLLELKEGSEPVLLTAQEMGRSASLRVQRYVP